MMNKRILFLFIILAGLVQFACRKDNGDSGTPVITNVRAVDSTARDSSFAAALPGTLIVIQGQNLGGLQAVYFNDTAANFNPEYATSTNIIVAIPSTAPTKAANPDVQNIIKVVTDHGTATYDFTLYLDPPVINSIAFDNSGTMVTINGTNLQGIQKITFPVPGADTALSYSVNNEFTQIVAEIPPGTATQDSIRVYCTYGVAAYSYPPPMTISSLSNENGAPGTTITVNGTNLIGINQVSFPGGIISTDVKPVNVTQFQVTVPQGISTAGNLTVAGGLGTAQSPLPYATYIPHPSPGYLSTFDDQNATNNTGFVGWTGGYADAATADAKYHGATGGVAYIQQSSPMPKNTGPGSQGNPGFIQLNDVPWVANTSQSINGYSLKFELYVAKPWTAGALWVMMGDWYGWSNNYLARYAPWETISGGKYQPSGWVTVTIPLTQFVSFSGNAWDLKSFPTGGAPASKFSDYPSTALCFAIANDQASPDIAANSIEIAIDNVRIVKGQ